MKIRTRIAAVVSAVLATLFVSTPALAHEGHAHESMYSSAGEPVNAVAIIIIGLILLVVTLLLSTWIGNLFQKHD